MYGTSITKLMPCSGAFKANFGTPAIRTLQSHSWRGKVREFQNTIERLIAFCQTETIHSSDVAAVLEKWHAQPAKTSFRDEQIQEIVDALNQTKGIQTTAAKLLGIDRTTLWRKMQRLGIHV